MGFLLKYWGLLEWNMIHKKKLYIFLWKIIKQFREVLCHLSATESRVCVHQEPSDHHLFIHLALCRNPHQVRTFSFQSFPLLIYFGTRIEKRETRRQLFEYIHKFIFIASASCIIGSRRPQTRASHRFHNHAL